MVEFLAIYKLFSNSEDIQESLLNGSLSSNFSSKTGLSEISAIEAIESVIDKNDRDMVLSSFAWEQLCFFCNPWQQGEVGSSGYRKNTQNFINSTSLNIDFDWSAELCFFELFLLQRNLFGSDVWIWQIHF